MKRKEEAQQSFQKGNNCAQSVLTAYAEPMGFDPKMAHALTSGFGAGMGRLQETCGAVTGAFMVIGLHNSEKIQEHAQSKAASVLMIQQFTKSFTAVHGSIKCGELLQCNLNTIEGQARFKEQELGKRICEACVGDSVELLDKMLFDN